MILFQSLMVFLVCINSTQAHYRIVSDTPTSSLSQKRTHPNFSGKTYISVLDKILTEIKLKKERLIFISGDLSDPILDIAPSILDSAPMGWSKSVLITNVSLENTQHLCVHKKGNIPAPSTWLTLFY